jgi:hypothetical protein
VGVKELRSVDIKRAQLVPSSVFASPNQVLETDELSLPQKLAILRRWEFDARHVAAFGEASMLRRIQHALRTLAARKQALTTFKPAGGTGLAPTAPREPRSEQAHRLLKL